MLPAHLPTTPTEQPPTRPRHKNRDRDARTTHTSSNRVVSLAGTGLNAAHIWPQASRLSRPLPGQTLPFASPKPWREATGERRLTHSHVTQQQPKTLSCCPSTVAGAKCTDANSKSCQGNRTDKRSQKRHTGPLNWLADGLAGWLSWRARSNTRNPQQARTHTHSHDRHATGGTHGPFLTQPSIALSTSGT